MRTIRTLGILLAACIATTFALSASAKDFEANLKRAEVVPPVQTSASGEAEFDVKDDMSISGHVETKGIKGIAAHIHQGAPGANGGVVVPLEAKGGDDWVVPKGAKLTAAQMDALKAGGTHANAHSDAHKDGEIRGQLKADEILAPDCADAASDFVCLRAREIARAPSG